MDDTAFRETMGRRLDAYYAWLDNQIINAIIAGHRTLTVPNPVERGGSITYQIGPEERKS